MSRSKSRQTNAAEWPALVAFFRGYLHQDAGQEHGSVELAFDQFWDDAAADERAAFARQWRLFLTRIEGRAWHRLERRLLPLGLAWMPQAGSGFSRLRAHIHERMLAAGF